MQINKEIKILTVDDDVVTRKLLTKVLGQIGLNHFEEAESAQEALDRLKQNQFDLVITDWNMPEMSGMDLIQALQKEESLKNIPVLMLTGETNPKQIIAAVKEGLKYFLMKPFDATTLLSKIEEIFVDSP